MAFRGLRPSRWWIALLAFAALYWILDLAVLRAGVPHPLDDVWEDGIAARQLVEGHGLRSTMIYPPLWSLHDPKTGSVPLMVHGPVLPLVLAIPLRLVGPPLLDQLAWIAAALAVAVALLTYRIGARVFGEPVGAAAGLWWTLSPAVLDAVHHSLSVVAGAALLLFALDLALRDPPRPLAAGLVLGLGYGVRPEFLVAAPVLAMLAGRRSATRVVLGFVAVAGMWWWHQWTVTGMPFFNLTSYTLLGSTAAHPEHSIMRDFDLPPERWPALLRAEWPVLWTKSIALLPRALRHALTALGLVVGWLAPIGAWAMLRTERHRGFAWAALAIACVPILMMTATFPVRLYLVPFLSLYALGAARGAEWMLDRARLLPHDPRRWVIPLSLVALIAAGPELARGARDARRSAALLSTERAGLERVRGSITLMFSDRPDFVAWTTGRPTLWVERREYRRLYPPQAPADTARPHGLPTKRDPSATWFHDDFWAPGHPEP